MTAALLVLVAAGAAYGDTVVVNNGDKISGTVEKLDGGKLSIATGYAGTIAINWDAVERLESEGDFNILTATGKTYTGQIERAADKLIVQGEGDPRELDILGVSGLTAVTEDAPPQTFREKISGGFDWGYNLTRGNSSLTQSALGMNAQYKDSKQKLSGIVTSIRSKQEDAESTSRHAGDARYDRFISDRTFAYALGGLERNRQALLDLRAKMGGGIGHQVINNETTTLSVLGGVNYTRDKFFLEDGTSGGPITKSGEGAAGLEFKTVRFNGIEFTSRLFLLPNLTDTGRYRLEYDGGVRLPVFNKFTYGLSFYDRYDSRPAVIVKKNDYGFISALGYTF